MIGPSGWSAGWVWGTVTLKLFGEVVGPSAYNVEDYQLCVARVNEDSYVLSPACCCEDGARRDEVISAWCLHGKTGRLVRRRPGVMSIG